MQFGQPAMSDAEPPPEFRDPETAVQRIEALTTTARNSWLLPGFLAFSGITLLSVRDVDGFSVSATSDLPIVDSAVTALVIWGTTPILLAGFWLRSLPANDAAEPRALRLGVFASLRTEYRAGGHHLPAVFENWVVRSWPEGWGTVPMAAENTATQSIVRPPTSGRIRCRTLALRRGQGTPAGRYTGRTCADEGKGRFIASVVPGRPTADGSRFPPEHLLTGNCALAPRVAGRMRL